jgi:hypothetical protein
MDIPCDETNRQLFNAGLDGAKMVPRLFFWHSAWLDGASPKDIAPAIFSASKRKNKIVQQVLQGNSWVQDINILAINTVQQLTHLNLNTADHIEWTLNTNGEYSTKSAYMVQFHGSINTKLDTLIWKSWAPAKCKCFAWLAVQDRLWIADRLARRGWPNQHLCPLCHSMDESIVHLLAHCQYSQRVWSAVRTWTEGQFLDPSGWASFEYVSIWWRAV